MDLIGSVIELPGLHCFNNYYKQTIYHFSKVCFPLAHRFFRGILKVERLTDGQQMKSDENLTYIHKLYIKMNHFI